MNLFGVGGLEVVIILLVALMVLRPAQLAGMARGLGKAMRELRNATSQFTRLVEDDDDQEGPGKPQGPGDSIPQ